MTVSEGKGPSLYRHDLLLLHGRNSRHSKQFSIPVARISERL